MLPLKKIHLGDDHEFTLIAMVNLAQSYYYVAGEIDKAAALYEEALPLLEKQLPPGNQNTLNAMKGLAMAYWSLDQIDDASRLAEDALSLSMERYGPTHGIRKHCEEVVRTVRQGPDSYEASKLMGGWLWAKVVSPAEGADPPISVEELMNFREACKRHPNGKFFNTLGLAEYRMENFTEAIAAASQKLSTTSARRLAILSMSLYQLGQPDRANVFRAYLSKTMAEDEVNNKLACRWLQDEANGLLDQRSEDAERIPLQPKLTPTFYTNCARAYAALGEWEKAIEDCDRAVGKNRELLTEVSVLKGRAFAALEDWNKAADAYAIGVADEPEDRMDWLRYIPTLVLSEKQTEYQLRCNEGLELARDTADPKIADIVCKLGLLVPNGVELNELPISVVEEALQDESTPRHLRSWFWTCKGLFELRSDKFGASIASIEESKSLNPNDRLRALNLSTLALAKHALNQQGQARQNLSDATDLIDQLNVAPEHQGHHDLLIATILHAEAVAKINEESNP